MSITRRSAPIFAFTALALLIAGCSVPGDSGAAAAPSATAPTPAASSPVGEPADEQTNIQACAIVQEVLADFSSLTEIDPGDPHAALKGLREAQENLDAAVDDITNSEVKPAAEQAVIALDDYVDFLEQVLDDPIGTDLEDMKPKLEAFQTGLMDLGMSCV